ncbi:MAG: phosphopantetheine-binding protein [Bacteroidales bacterium]|jgi:acyl carrier protein|nr:phosphopantetheine-binding protein [Bacteroidales bacterium]
MNDQLIHTLKQQLIEALNLEDMTPDDIETDIPLFGAGLGLDSIDALEIILLLEKHYGIRIENPSEGKNIFYSVETIADYIEKHQPV